MTGIGMGLAFGGYTLALWGYCLIRGYNVPFKSMFGQTWPGQQNQITGSATITATPGHALGTVTGNQEIVTGPPA
jgi:hypothetical protein